MTYIFYVQVELCMITKSNLVLSSKDTMENGPNNFLEFEKVKSEFGIVEIVGDLISATLR